MMHTLNGKWWSEIEHLLEKNHVPQVPLWDRSRVGSLVGGRYRLVKLLAAKQTALWAGWDIRSNHPRGVAKVVIRLFDHIDYPTQAQRTEARRYFEADAARLGSIAPDHCARIYDAGIDNDGTPFLVSEFLQGQTLQERLDSDGPLSRHQVREVALQALHAIGEAHGFGRKHGGIKLSNIFWCGSNTPNTRLPAVKVIDWDLGRYFREECFNLAPGHDLPNLARVLKQCRGDKPLGLLAEPIAACTRGPRKPEPTAMKALLAFAQLRLPLKETS